MGLNIQGRHLLFAHPTANHLWVKKKKGKGRKEGKGERKEGKAGERGRTGLRAQGREGREKREGRRRWWRVEEWTGGMTKAIARKR
jgi:hypothetical protein